jgi:hypothetical protein
VSESDLLSCLTDVITTREFDTPYGVLPAGSLGTISDYTHVGYLVDFAAPWYVVSVPHDLLLPSG